MVTFPWLLYLFIVTEHYYGYIPWLLNISYYTLPWLQFHELPRLTFNMITSPRLTHITTVTPHCHGYSILKFTKLKNRSELIALKGISSSCFTFLILFMCPALEKDLWRDTEISETLGE